MAFEPKVDSPWTNIRTRINQQNLQLRCCPIGRPKTDVGVGSSNLNFAELWLSCVRFTSLNSLKCSGFKQPTITCHCVFQFADSKENKME